MSIQNRSEGCWKFSFAITGMHYILKYIKIDNSSFKLLLIFHNINVFTVFFIK